MGNNEQFSVSNGESSENSDKNQKSEKAAKARIVKSLARSDALFGPPDQRKDGSKAPIRLPLPPPESILPPAENKDDDEDEEDDDEEKVSVESPTGVEAGAVEADEPADGPASQSPEEVFQTMASAKDAEFMDIPHVDHDRPQIPLTPAENRAFTEMVSEMETPEEPSDTEKRSMPPIPSWDMPTVPHPLGSEEAPPRPVPATGSTTPFWRPSPTPSPFESSAPAPSMSAPESTASTPYSTAELSSGVTAVVETLKAASSLVEMASNPDKLITRVLTQALTTAAVDGFLRQRRQERGGGRQMDQITELQDRQRQANERLATLFQEQAKDTEQESKIIDQNGNTIALKRGQHYEVAAGGFGAVVDKRGNVVRDAFAQGEAFQNEQRREQMSDDVFAKLGGPGGSSGATQDAGGLGGMNAPFPPVTGQSQVGSQNQYSYSGQPDDVDLNHRLPEPRNSLKDAVVSPWLWTAVAILIIVYFLAALA